MKRNQLFGAKTLVRVGMMAAVAFVLARFEITVIAFYKLDVSNLPVLMAMFSMGLAPGLFTLLVKEILEVFVSQSLGIGQLANLVVTAAMLVPASLLYERERTRKNALLGLLLGTACMAAVGAVFNYFVLIPFYLANFSTMTPEIIVGMAQKVLPFVDSMEKFVVFVTVPFNILKGLVLSALTMLLYKRLSPLLRAGRR